MGRPTTAARSLMPQLWEGVINPASGAGLGCGQLFTLLCLPLAGARRPTGPERTAGRDHRPVRLCLCVVRLGKTEFETTRKVD